MGNRSREDEAARKSRTSRTQNMLKGFGQDGHRMCLKVTDKLDTKYMAGSGTGTTECAASSRTSRTENGAKTKTSRTECAAAAYRV